MTRKLRFALNPDSSPTYANLAHYLMKQTWSRTRFEFLANFSETNFQFDFAAAEQLEFKDLLAQLVQKYCPHTVPRTYCINETNWPSLLNQVADAQYPTSDKIGDLVWILKPAQLNNGHHIKIFESLSQIEAHFLSPNRLGGDHVLQEYITHPHLLKGPKEGHKYSIRMFLILTNYAGAYLYPHGYFNVALQPYAHKDFTQLNAHLTNEHLSDEQVNVIQIPTQQIVVFKTFYTQIKYILDAVIMGLNQLHHEAFVCKKTRKLAIFGFDFMVDVNEKVWLIEANHGPCFPTTAEHPLFSTLYHSFWQAFIKSFVFPIAEKTPVEKIRYHLFEPVSTKPCTDTQQG
ncbi:MAG: tubulin-tyrosine ligase [Legionella sp.]|nr:tubulin-tyrosine ligase [Legionella sp.]